jgi:hypothetical protein
MCASSVALADAGQAKQASAHTLLFPFACLKGSVKLSVDATAIEMMFATTQQPA